MKKVLPFLVGVFLTITMFYACDVSKQLSDVEKVGFVCNNYVGKKPNEMQRQDVLDMISNYYTNQYAALHDRNSATSLKLPPGCPVDSRAVFFNYDTLQRLLYYMALASKNYSQQEKENMGVNIYFASYPKDFKHFRGPNDYTNRHTLIFVPSMFDPGQKRIRDLNIAENIYNHSPKPNFIDSTFFTKPFGSSTIIALGSPGNALAGQGGMTSQNDGTGTPPPPRTENPLLNLTDPN